MDRGRCGPVITCTAGPPALTRETTTAIAFTWATRRRASPASCRSTLDAGTACRSRPGDRLPVPEEVTVDAGDADHEFAVTATDAANNATTVVREWPTTP